MVLDSYGIIKTEEELRALSDCTHFGGTDAYLLVEAARHLGLGKTRKYSMGFSDLRQELERGMFPIVYIRTRLSEDGPPQLHAVVVVETRLETILVHDPWRGEHLFSKDEFVDEWSESHGLTIVIE